MGAFPLLGWSLSLILTFYSSQPSTYFVPKYKDTWNGVQSKKVELQKAMDDMDNKPEDFDDEKKLFKSDENSEYRENQLRKAAQQIMTNIKMVLDVEKKKPVVYFCWCNSYSSKINQILASTGTYSTLILLSERIEIAKTLKMSLTPISELDEQKVILDAIASDHNSG